MGGQPKTTQRLAFGSHGEPHDAALSFKELSNVDLALNVDVDVIASSMVCATTNLMLITSAAPTTTATPSAKWQFSVRTMWSRPVTTTTNSSMSALSAEHRGQQRRARERGWAWTHRGADAEVGERGSGCDSSRGGGLCEVHGAARLERPKQHTLRLLLEQDQLLFLDVMRMSGDARNVVCWLWASE